MVYLTERTIFVWYIFCYFLQQRDTFRWDSGAKNGSKVFFILFIVFIEKLMQRWSRSVFKDNFFLSALFILFLILVIKCFYLLLKCLSRVQTVWMNHFRKFLELNNSSDENEFVCLKHVWMLCVISCKHCGCKLYLFLFMNQIFYKCP